MKKFSTLTAVFVVMFAMAASASTELHPAYFSTRTFTMGGANVNNIVKDAENIWLYPQTISMYTDEASGVFSDQSATPDDFARFGVNFQFGESNPFALGVYIDNGFAFNPYSAYSWNRTPFWAGLNNNRQFNLFYGRNLNGNPFGVHLLVFNSKNEFVDAATTNPQNFNASMTAFGLNFGLTTGGGDWDWAGGIFFSTYTDERANFGAPSTTWTEPDGSMNLDFRARRWFVRSSKVTWVGHGSVAYGKTGIKWDVGTPAVTNTDEWKHLMLDFGFGLNYTPTSKVLAVMDVGVSYSKDDRTSDDGTTVSESSVKRTSIPPYYTVGVDAEVLSWLDVRMGASNWRMNTVNEQANSDKSTDNFNSIDTYLGFGFHWGNLSIDTHIDPEWITAGPYFLSGSNETDEMFMTVAATLHFGN